MADPTQKREFDAKELDQLEKLAGLGLNLSQIGSILGVSRSTLDRRMKDQKGVVEAIEKGRALALAQVAKTAFQLATSGKCYPMTMFYLKCRGGWSETDAEVENQDKYKAPKSLTRVA